MTARSDTKMLGTYNIPKLCEHEWGPTNTVPSRWKCTKCGRVWWGRGSPFDGGPDGSIGYQIGYQPDFDDPEDGSKQLKSITEIDTFRASALCRVKAWSADENGGFLRFFGGENTPESRFFVPIGYQADTQRSHGWD